MRALWTWLMGRKTYVLSGGLAAIALALLVTGRLSVHAAMMLLLLAAFGFPATFRSALEIHHAESMALLEELAETGAAVASHNLPGAMADGQAAFRQGEAIAQECHQEANAS